MWNRLTTGAKILIVLIIAGGISAALYYGGVLGKGQIKAQKKTAKNENGETNNRKEVMSMWKDLDL